MSAGRRRRAADEAWLFEGGSPADRTGERLEGLLALQRTSADVVARPARRTPAGSALPRAWIPALAAALLLAVLGAWWLTADGSGYAVRSAGGLRRVGAGERIESGAGPARVEVARLGEVTLREDSVLRVLAADAGAHRFFLERGALEASISAEPRAFQVATRAGNSVDLGCLYRLEVDEDGTTHLSVDFGRVAFEDPESGRNVYVPAGASCSARPGRGPGSPSFDGGDPVWRAALAELDFIATPEVHHLRALEDSLDELGLWHLLGATSSEVRAAAYDRLGRLAPPPEGASRAAIVASADQRAGTPAHAARRAWLERGGFWWYSFDW